MSPEKQRSSTTNETPSSEWPGVASDWMLRPPVSTGPDVISSAEALDELVVAGDVIRVAVCDEEVRRRDPLALDGGEQRLERRAAVDENGCSSRLVGEQEAVREP